jgi:hypothetical protein
MGNSPERRRNARTFTDTTTKRVQEIKNGLVLQVATKKGAFWKEICKIRARWDIHAPTQLPPANADLYLGRLLPSEAKLTEQDIYDLHSWERDIKRLGLWLAVPGLERCREEIEWWPFMAALVLYQPPLDALREYGERCRISVEPGVEFCWAHDPANREQRQRITSRAGKSKPNKELLSIKARLSALADEVLDGSTDKAVGAVASQILNVYLRALEQEREWKELGEIEERISALEDQARTREDSRRWR